MIEFPNLEQQLFAASGSVASESGGEFNHLVWRTLSMGDHTEVESQLITLHEWAHHELNNVTVYGGLLTAVAHLARCAKKDRDRYRTLLGELVSKCLSAHESYATWFSTNLLLNNASLLKLTSSFSDQYLSYYKAAEALVSEVESPFLRQQAVIAAIRICFDDIAFFEAGHKLSNLRIDHFSPESFPDARFGKLLKIIEPGYFETELQRFYSHYEEEGLIIQNAVSARDTSKFFTQVDPHIVDNATRLLLQSLHNGLASTLLKYDHHSNPFEHHLVLFREIINQIQDLSDEVEGVHQLVLADDPHDNVTIVLQQMENEILYVRDSPLPSCLVPFSSIDDERWPHLLSGEPQHLFFCTRHVNDLLKQHDFPAGQLERYSGYLTFLRRRGLVDNELRCEHIIFDTPEELLRFGKSFGEILSVASLSMQALTNAEWSDQWIEPISEISIATILFDRSLVQTLKDGWNQFEEVRYAKGTLSGHAATHVFLAFLCQSADETYSLFFMPCSELQIRAVDAYIRTKLDGEKFIHDNEFLSSIPEIVSPIVSHLFAEEQFFSLNGLSYQES